MIQKNKKTTCIFFICVGRGGGGGGKINWPGQLAPGAEDNQSEGKISQDIFNPWGIAVQGA